MGQPLPAILISPHRPFFLAGVVQFIITMLIWLCVLCGWYIPHAPAPTLTVFGTAVHAFLMLFGLMPFFVFGFALTAFPRWVGTPQASARRFAGIAICMALGVSIFYLGLFTSRTLAIIGALLLAIGWGAGSFTLFQHFAKSERPGRKFALFPMSCIAAGDVGLLLYVLWLIFPDTPLMEISIDVGTWLFLVPLIVAVSYRMIPFFSSRVLDNYPIVKPGWTLPAALICVVVHCLLAITGQHELTFISDIPLTAIAAWHSWHWNLRRSLRVPLLAVLHISFAWLTIAMALYSLSSLLLLFGSDVSLGTAPLHALTIGFIGSMVIAMATRVNLGHSGRPLVAGRVALFAFGLVQITAIVRVLADCPPLDGARTTLLLLAAVIWLIGILPWSLQNGQYAVMPRIDGK